MDAGPPVTHDIKTIPKHLIRGGTLMFDNGIELHRAPNGVYHYKTESGAIAGFTSEQQLLEFINENKPWRTLRPMAVSWNQRK